jgi:hemolysin activation/secretion protein
MDASLYFGLDGGRVWGPSDVNLAGHYLAGAALGVRGRWRVLQFDLALAAPIVKPPGFKTSRLTPYASATYAF